MREGGDFVADRAAQNVIDVLAFFGGIVAGLGALFERPVEAGGEARGADQARRIFEERIVVQNANESWLRCRRRR